MKRGNITLFIVVVIVILTLLIILLGIGPKIESLKRDNGLSNFQEYFDGCALYAITRSNVLFGFTENTEGYEISMIDYTEMCMQPFLDALKDRGYSIIREKMPKAYLEVNENNLVIEINYPIEIKSDYLKFEFSRFTKTFDRIVRIKLDELDRDSVFSPDNIGTFGFLKDTELVDIYGNPTDELVLVKVSDKRELKGEELQSNLIYGLLPLGHVTTKPIKVCFYKDDFLINSVVPLDRLRIAWWNPVAEDWGFLPTEFKDGCLSVQINYTTFYGVMETKDPPEGIPGIDDDSEDSGFIPTPVNPDYPIYPANGRYVELFEKINSEMGGPYGLNANPNCVLGGNQVYCFVGYVDSCGTTAVNCKGNMLQGMGDTELNVLLRHEITHSLQQVNAGCPSTRLYSEWGAEYYSKANYYTFTAGGKVYSATQLGEEMIKKGCSESEVMDLAFCVEGALEKLDDGGCLLGYGHQLAESVSP